MDFLIIIPAHNEESYLTKTLQSLIEQTILPKKIIVVNDSSTDGTQKIIDQFSEKYEFIKGVYHNSEETHSPGSKVVKAFYKGLQALNDNFDVICKFDADLIFPNNYLEQIAVIFQNDQKVGMAGGFCYIEKSGQWVLENLTNTDHIRGALKAYRNSCFEEIQGPRNSMGWDTVDELLAQYHGWKIKTDPSLRVKHLKRTGKDYTKASRLNQGKAFYKMRYGFCLTVIASGKLALRKNSLRYFTDCIKGFLYAKKENLQFMVSEKEGEFIRSLRWKGIREKLGLG